MQKGYNMFTEQDLDELIRNIEDKAYRTRQVPVFYSSAYKDYNALPTDGEKQKWLDDNFLKGWYWDWVVE